MTALLANDETNSTARRVVSPNRSRLESILRRTKLAPPPPPPTTDENGASPPSSLNLDGSDNIENDDSPSASPSPTPPLSPSASSKGSSSTSSSEASPSSLTRVTTIRFSEEEDRTLIIPNRDDYTVQDMHTLYFQSFEYQQIRSNNKILVRMMDDPCTNGTNGVNFEDDKQYCFRGLEHRSAKEAPSRKYNKAMAARAVFLEQFRQCREGLLHTEGADDCIRKAYRAISIDSQQSARRWGVIDERYARAMAGLTAKTEEPAVVFDDKNKENASENTNPNAVANENVPIVDEDSKQLADKTTDGSENQKNENADSTGMDRSILTEHGISPLLEFEETDSMSAAREDCTFSGRPLNHTMAPWPMEMTTFGVMDEIVLGRKSPRFAQPPASPSHAAIA